MVDFNTWAAEKNGVGEQREKERERFFHKTNMKEPFSPTYSVFQCISVYFEQNSIVQETHTVERTLLGDLLLYLNVIIRRLICLSWVLATRSISLVIIRKELLFLFINPTLYPYSAADVVLSMPPMVKCIDSIFETIVFLRLNSI